jgi:CHAT domain-containing protein
MAENNLAFVYALQNKFRESENMYRQALERAQTLNLTVTQAEIEASMGDLALFRGRFDVALKLLENSRQKYFSLKMPHQESIAELEIADVYLELNLAPEAIEIYQKVAPKFAELKMQAEEARARLQFGRALVLLGKNAEALKELEKAAALYSAEGNTVGVGVVRRTEARLSLRREEWKSAARLSVEAEQIFDEAGSLRNQLIAAWMHGEALRNLTQTTESQSLLANTLAKSLTNEQPNIALLCQTSLGKLASATNEIAKAWSYFQKAIETIENLRAPLPADEFRTAFLADKIVPYHELAKLSLNENEPAEAFGFVERARSRSLAEMMNGHVRLSEKNLNQSSAKLLLQLSELREELNWYYSRLNRPAVGDMKEATQDVESWQTSANQIEHRIAELSRQLNSLNENTFIANINLNLEFLQQELGGERALVEYACLDSELLAFVVTNERVAVVEHLGNEEEIRTALEQLQMQFGTLRYGAKNLKQYFPQLIKRANFYLQKLYETLVEPLEHLLGERHLVVVPYKSLHYVPFHALFDGEQYLIENREVSYAPGAVVLQNCLRQNLKVKDDLQVLLIGVADEKIPLVDKEIRALKQIFPHADELRNEQAEFAVFKKHAPQADVLHLACHGQFRPDNPLFSSLHLADGRITVRDVCALELNARLAVLSACETGLNLVAEGDEILGLSRGFFMAGVNSLLLTLWTVSDEATINLMKSFYNHLQSGKPLAAALRHAQVEFIRQNSHPYYWSPFALIGSWK